MTIAVTKAKAKKNAMPGTVDAPKKKTERATLLFKQLVELYIQSGEPIGSKTLAQTLRLSLSSATVRHVLAELEKQGYLYAPHKSAGRAPTVSGYRLFVDILMTHYMPSSDEHFYRLKKKLNPAARDTSDLLFAACKLASELTSLTSLATLPKKPQRLLSHIEFLPLSNHRILAVLIFNGQNIQNRVICPQKSYSPSELQQASNYLNQHFKNLSLGQIKKKLIQTMEKNKKALTQLMAEAIQNENEEDLNDFILSGENHLFEATADVPQLREILGAFHQKQDILYLLEQCLHTKHLHIYIGKETGHSALEAYSIVSAPYLIANEVAGTLAIVGPLRMAYDKAIAAVDSITKLLSLALNQKK